MPESSALPPAFETLNLSFLHYPRLMARLLSELSLSERRVSDSYFIVSLTGGGHASLAPFLFPVFAQIGGTDPGGPIGGTDPSSRITNPIQSNTFGELMAKIADAAAKIGLPLVAVFMIYAGFLFVSARGN